MSTGKVIGISIIFVVVFVFYWYEWRPSRIRKECYAIAERQAISTMRSRATMDIQYDDRSDPMGWDRERQEERKEAARKGMYQVGDFVVAYKHCLQSKGLKE